MLILLHDAFQEYSWMQGHHKCQMRDTELATINTKEEFEAIKTELEESRYYWIGGHKQGTGMVWWPFGAAAEDHILNMGVSKPSASDDRCAAYDLYYGITFNNCNDKFHYICEEIFSDCEK